MSRQAFMFLEILQKNEHVKDDQNMLDKVQLQNSENEIIPAQTTQLQQQTTEERGDCTQWHRAGKWNSPYNNNIRHSYANHSACHTAVCGYLAHNWPLLIFVNRQRGAMHPAVCTEVAKADEWWSTIWLHKSKIWLQLISGELQTLKYWKYVRYMMINKEPITSTDQTKQLSRTIGQNIVLDQRTASTYFARTVQATSESIFI